jgi:hypothetical protein
MHTDTSSGPNFFRNGGGCIHLGIRDERREAISGDSRRQCPGGQSFGHALRDADDHIVAHVHSEGFVDDVQPVDVEVENDVGARRLARRPEQRRGLPFKCLAGHQAGARIILSLDDAGRPFCQHLRDAGLMQIEVLRTRRIEQGEHAHDPFRRMPHGAG